MDNTELAVVIALSIVSLALLGLFVKILVDFFAGQKDDKEKLKKSDIRDVIPAVFVVIGVLIGSRIFESILVGILLAIGFGFLATTITDKKK